MSFFARRPLVGTPYSPRSSNIPKLSAIQLEALDYVQSVAEKVAISIKLNRGNMIFWNNRVLMHCRQGFTDTPENKRHLVRVWLRDEGAGNGSVPPQLESLWDHAFVQDGWRQQWPLEPIKDRPFITVQTRSSGHD